MPKTIDSAVEIQRDYYTKTASRYDTMHAFEGVDDPVSSRMILAILHSLEVRSVLDVGSATGRGLQQFATSFPGALVCGIEPVAALLQQGVAAGVTKRVPLLQGTGQALPFGNAAFDAVCEFATLHHVPDPRKVVQEMTRVARRAVVICDSNRFGQGPLVARLFKLFLYKIGLWSTFDYIRTGGKRYQISEGDGLFYSYSVYDTYDVVAKWADRVLIIPSVPGPSNTWFHPLLSAPGVILIGIRESNASGEKP